MEFEFTTPSRVVFGAGSLNGIGAIANEFGQRALVVTGRDASRAERLVQLLQDAGVSATTFAVNGEPELSTVEKGVEEGRTAGAQFVIGFGGGSALDAAKAIAAMMSNDGELLDYVEVIGRGKPLPREGQPFIAIPTTAGTGSEVTRNAVLSSPAHKVKVSLRSPHMLARVALVDPELTYNMPPAITASTGLDALTQLIEPFVSTRANPMTDALSRDGICRAARSVRTVCADGYNAAARADMALASLYSGFALANAGLGAVHGFAGPLGGMFPNAPHGAVCAILLPHVVAANLRALRERLPDSEALRRYEEVARMLTGNALASADDGVEWIRALVDELKITRLSNYGLTAAAVTEVVEKARNASSMKANPVVLTPDELAEVLHAAR